MKKWYSFETMFMEVAEELKEFLNETVDKFEVSDGRMSRNEPMIWHFEIEATEEQLGEINGFLDFMAQISEV